MDEMLVGASVPAIAAIVYWLVNLIKYTTNNDERVKKFIPLISSVLGVIFGLICFFLVPNIMPTGNILVAIVIGAASGLSATGFHQIIKQIDK